MSRPDARRVLLWPDTFNNHFHPETAMAAVETLEYLGYEVVIPPKTLCCGRPLYDFGFLDMAKARLREIMEVLRPELERGTPIVGLEPSCISVFRDELYNLFPADEDSKRLRNSFFTLSELLERENCEIPKLKRRALVQSHCHHNAIMKFDAEERVMKKMGLEVDHPDAGCCGMAGAFGFVADNYEVSIRAGERVILPKVRQADRETVIIADGFSCREQIAQTTGREALHLAQVMQMAIREGERSEPVEFPERRYIEKKPAPDWRDYAALGAIAGGALLGALLIGHRIITKRRLRRDSIGNRV